MFERQTSDFWRSGTIKDLGRAEAKKLSQEPFPVENFQSQTNRSAIIPIQHETRQAESEANTQPEQRSTPQRTVHRAIRLDEEVAGIIAEQARQEHTTDVQVIQRAMDRYAHWHLWEEKFGFISVPSSMEQKLMSLLSEGQARELGRHLAETFAQDFVRYVFKTPNLASVLAAFRYLTRPYANFFSLQEHNPEDHTLSFFHDQGIKVSILWEEIISYALREIARVEVRIEHTENQITVHYTIPK